jgi:hypothetical protein
MALRYAAQIRDWNPRDDNMADMVSVEVFGAFSRFTNDLSLHGLTDRQLLILLDATVEQLQMNGVIVGRVA